MGRVRPVDDDVGEFWYRVKWSMVEYGCWLIMIRSTGTGTAVARSGKRLTSDGTGYIQNLSTIREARFCGLMDN
jgi:hypothetical protein